MPYALLSDTFGSDPVLLILPRGVRLLWVEGLSYCAQHLTDGAIPQHSLTRITDEPEPQQAAEQLVAAGLWEPTTTGWEMVDYLGQQRSREQVEKARAETAERKRRNQLHKDGDHSRCIKGRFCPGGAIEPRTREQTRDGTRTSRTPIQANPIRPQGGLVKAKGSGADAPPPWGSADVNPEKIVVHILGNRESYRNAEDLADAVAQILTMTEAQRTARPGIPRAAAHHTQAALDVLRSASPEQTVDEVAGDLVRRVLAVDGITWPAEPRVGGLLPFPKVTIR